MPDQAAASGLPSRDTSRPLFLPLANILQAAARSRSRNPATTVSACDLRSQPYRIRRRPASPDIRRELTDEARSLLARMTFHHAWLQIEASAVAGPCAALVTAARSEAAST